MDILCIYCCWFYLFMFIFLLYCYNYSVMCLHGLGICVWFYPNKLIMMMMISGFCKFRHSCGACGLFTAEINETNRSQWLSHHVTVYRTLNVSRLNERNDIMLQIKKKSVLYDWLIDWLVGGDWKRETRTSRDLTSWHQIARVDIATLLVWMCENLLIGSLCATSETAQQAATMWLNNQSSAQSSDRKCPHDKHDIPQP